VVERCRFGAVDACQDPSLQLRPPACLPDADHFLCQAKVFQLKHARKNPNQETFHSRVAIRDAMRMSMRFVCRRKSSQQPAAGEQIPCSLLLAELMQAHLLLLVLLLVVLVLVVVVVVVVCVCVCLRAHAGAFVLRAPSTLATSLRATGSSVFFLKTQQLHPTHITPTDALLRKRHNHSRYNNSTRRRGRCHHIPSRYNTLLWDQ